MYYERHIFFCTNSRDEGPCCAEHGSKALRDYAKQRVKDLGIRGGEGGMRVNASGCLNRCHEGPVAVVYPEGVWYTYADKRDIDEIIDEHIVKGRVVERLQI